MRRIIRENDGTLPDDDEPFCENCGLVRDQARELHIDHVDPDGGCTDGGWQSFYRCLEDFEDGKDLQVLCDVCHYLKSLEEQGKEIERLQMRLPHLQEYNDKDPGFFFKLREGKHFDGERA